MVQQEGLPLPFAHSVRNRLTPPVRALLTLTILAVAACDRTERLAAPSDDVTASLLVATAGTDTKSPYYRISLRSNATLCLDLVGSPSTPGVRTKIATCDPNKATQRFAISTTTREILSSGGLCLSIVTNQIANGAIGLLACSPAPRSHWTLNQTTGRLMGPETGCVTVAGSSALPGALQLFGKCGAYPVWSQGFSWAAVGTPGSTPPPAPATSISVSPQSVSLAIGGTQQLTPVALDATGKPVLGAAFAYSLTTSGAAASVSATGLVTAKAAGKDTVRVTSGSLSTKVGVNVSAVATPVASISVSPSSVSLAISATQQLSPVALDATGNPVSGVAFAYGLTTAGSAASISPTGLVTAKAAGTDTVRVASGSVSVKVGVNVIAVGPPPPPPSGLRATDPTLPLDSVRVLWPMRTGQQWAVHAGDNLQTILNQAQRGDEIVIDPGISFTGNFVLPVKPGSAATGWILVRSANLGGLPPGGARATPRFASAMPKLITPNVMPALTTTAGTSGWYIAGIELTLNSPTNYVHYGIVNLGVGSSKQSTLASVPSNIVLDRVYIHGIPTVSLQRCLGLNSAYTAVVNSTLSQCAAKGFDSQAIGGWNGPGPYRIENNYLEGAGENVMFGGGDPYIPNLIPSDITMRGNHITKPLSWRGVYTVKNLLETKNVRRLLIENNIFENNWADGQTGFAMLFKSANQTGLAPWSQTSDVLFRYNILRRSAAGFSVAANPSPAPAVPAARIKLEHNLIYEVGSFNGTMNGRMVQLMQRLSDIQVVNNTLVHNAITGQFILIADQGPAQRLIIRDNVSTWGGPWGAVMGLAPQGTQALAAYAPSSYSFDRNVVIGLPLTLLFGYPTTSFYSTTMLGIGFVNPGTYDFRLSSSSPYIGRSTTNGNPGADVAAVMARTANVIVP